LLPKIVQCNPVLSASRQSVDPQAQESAFSIVPLIKAQGAYEQESVCSSQSAPLPKHFFLPHKQGDEFGEVPFE
jgi:hypothetical protein